MNKRKCPVWKRLREILRAHEWYLDMQFAAKAMEIHEALARRDDLERV